jgi:hypothetical protein
MADRATLEVELHDVYGDWLHERTTIRLQNRRLGGSSIFKGLDASGKISLAGLEPYPHALYSVRVEPESFMPVARFVLIPASNKSRIVLHFPVDPDRVVEVEFADFRDLPEEAQELLKESDSVLGFEGRAGEELYTQLDDIRRAGLLNIIAKCRDTPLGNGRSVLSHVERLVEVRGDRFFAAVPKVLREEVKNSVVSGLFDPVSGSLHHPPKGYSTAGSFKTDDSYGNLQVTFFARGENWVADIDIDDAAGLRHLFQVLGNWLTGRPTHPYNIHEILVFHQQLDPQYRFQV